MLAATAGCGRIGFERVGAGADGGAPDAGARDGGARDAGRDGGPRDAGAVDSGARDAGPDAATADAGIDASVDPCTPETVTITEGTVETDIEFPRVHAAIDRPGVIVAWYGIAGGLPHALFSFVEPDLSFTPPRVVDDAPRVLDVGLAAGAGLHLATWLDARSGPLEIYAREIRPDGSFGVEQRITNNDVDDRSPVAAWVGAGFAFAFSRGPAGAENVYVRRAGAGIALDIPVTDTTTASETAPDLVATTGGYAVAYAARTGTAVRQVRVQRLEADAPVGASILIEESGDDELETPVLAALPGDRLVVAWDRSGGGTDSGVYISVVGADGVRTPPLRISTVFAHHPHLLTVEDRVVAVWAQDDADFDTDIVLATIDPAGPTVGPVHVVADRPGVQQGPTIARTADGTFYVAYMDRPGGSGPNAVSVTRLCVE